LELKKLALSSDASLLDDLPEDLGWIAKRLMKNWWTKHVYRIVCKRLKKRTR
jgi:hypothetical protein